MPKLASIPSESTALRYGICTVDSILGFIFIWMLRRSAEQERIEKTLKKNDRDKARSLRGNC